MKKRTIIFYLPTILYILLFVSCNKDNVIQPNTTISDNFESGSIGEIIKNSNTNWTLNLANDNDDSELPDTWRNWWYVKVDNSSIDSLTKITLTKRGWPFYYLPVFSYNQKDWFRFTEDEVIQSDNSDLQITKQFEASTVWIARFYPYTFTDLENYLDNLNENKYIKIEKKGNSQNGKPIYLLKVSDFDKPLKSKKRVFIHARTHPGETPPSFLIEGMIDYLQTESSVVKNILSEFEFYIFPMQNVDGVIAGNYRTTPQTENLEVMWNYDNENPLNLIATTPPEIDLIHNYAKDLMLSDEPKVSMALNLHASNSEPDIRPFFFPHFGTEDQGYSTKEASLWNKQIKFITAVGSHHGMDMIEPISTEGGSSFASKTYPESWWWVNFQDEVMAITMELTYGKSGYSPKWIEPDDIRDLGKSLVLGIVDYYNESFDPKPYLLKSSKNNSILKYPDLYPPKATDELKE